jgi:hypothetical protein
MSVVKRYLGANIYFVHFGHGLLALTGLGFVLVHIPWQATVALSPLLLLCVLFWVYTARIVLPIAKRLWREPATGVPAKDAITPRFLKARTIDKESNV